MMDIRKEMKKLIKEEIVRFLKNIKTNDKEKMDNVINFLERGWEYERILQHIGVISDDEQVNKIIRDTLLGG